MEKFIPTDEQLFDYHLQAVDPRLGREIQAYLAFHPEAVAMLQDYQKIETAFKSYPLDQPSNEVLENVSAMARRQVSSRKNIFGFLKPGFHFRELSWALTIILVVGLGYTLHEVREGSFVTPQQEVAENADVKLSDTAKAAAVYTADTLENTQEQNAFKRVDEAVSGFKVNDENQKSFRDYETALELFKNSHFKEASDIFSHIMTSQPAFEKRAELYTYWIQALEELGALELANEKREELNTF